MGMKKIIFLIVVALFLNGCFQMVAFVGPALTGATGGNITHSVLSYSLSYSVKKVTGKTPIEQVISLTKEKQAKIRKNGLLKKLLSQHSETVMSVY
jgi:outer membrane lipoprotein-sorting protein|tara:strand:- start:346 stop:633 length:288 start_codon:yes stop_codon:yes gene_type:complete